VSHPQTVRLRLSPSEFGALWTWIKNDAGFDGIKRGFSFVFPLSPETFLAYNKIQLIDEDDPADPPRWGNGKLNVPETFGMWRRHLLLSDWYDSIERCREANHA
jgi:hypothetical protein